MRDYREKLVDGWITNGCHISRLPVRVRMTSDERGQSLSLTAELGKDDAGIQIGIPLEMVREIIKKVENK